MELQKIIQLLESNDHSNVLLALQLAQNYQSEFEAHYGGTVEDYRILLTWLEEQFTVEYPLSNTVLDLAELDLDEIPTQIGLLTHIIKLRLYGNHLLKRLPSEISRLKNLKILDLQECPLGSLPPEIGHLNQLEELNVRNNHIETLPPEFIHLENLTYLDLKDNYLHLFPIEICKLKKLRYLYLSNNQLKAIPPAIKQLKSLRQLDLNHNQLAEIPPEIGQLEWLFSLDLRNNQLRNLPSEIGQLEDLTQLDLRHNHLQNLPDCLANMYVKDIYVAGNPDLEVSDTLKNSGKLIFE